MKYKRLEQAARYSVFCLQRLRQLLVRMKKKRPGYIVIPIAILVCFAVIGAFGPLLAPHSPTQTDLSLKYQPPAWDAAGSWDYPLGTDNLGRDIFSRLLAGARVSLVFALLAVGVSGAFGTLLGLIAGYYGSWVDAVIMRLVDVMMSLPMMLVAMVVVIVLGASFVNLIFVMSFLMWSFFARLVRGDTLSIKEKDFVALAKTSGRSSPGIIARHIFPNLVHGLVVLATLQVGFVILAESSLSFLGVGIPPPTPAWGLMVADGRSVLDIAWWVSLFPGLAIGAVVLAVNLFGDWLRDRLDPRLRQV
ncbi:ABC transporter permease [Chloroflexota bacterium]